MGHGAIKRELLLAKIETTYGTDPTPAGSNAMLVEEVSVSPEGLRMIERPSIRASLGTLQHTYAGMLLSLTCQAEVKGSGTAGTAPEIGPLLRACGLTETIVASTSVSYQPRSLATAFESVAMYYFEAAAGAATQVRHVLLGCRGNVTLTWQAGGKLMANFSITGKVSANPTDVSLPTPTYHTTVPVGIRGLATTVGGVSGLVIQQYSLNLNNQIQIPDSIADTEGFGDVVIVSRDPAIDFGRHNELVATIAPYADLRAGTNRAFASGTLGATAGNRIALTAGQMHYRNVQQAVDNAMRAGTYAFGLHESSAANDEFVLAFT
jgi:hypothetical protein